MMMLSDARKVDENSNCVSDIKNVNEEAGIECDSYTMHLVMGLRSYLQPGWNKIGIPESLNRDFGKSWIGKIGIEPER